MMREGVMAERKGGRGRWGDRLLTPTVTARPGKYHILNSVAENGMISKFRDFYIKVFLICPR